MASDTNSLAGFGMDKGKPTALGAASIHFIQLILYGKISRACGV